MLDSRWQLSVFRLNMGHGSRVARFCAAAPNPSRCTRLLSRFLRRNQRISRLESIHSMSPRLLTISMLPHVWEHWRGRERTVTLDWERLTMVATFAQLREAGPGFWTAVHLMTLGRIRPNPANPSLFHSQSHSNDYETIPNSQPRTPSPALRSRETKRAVSKCECVSSFPGACLAIVHVLDSSELSIPKRK
jgi:hypothetical protein